MKKTQMSKIVPLLLSITLLLSACSSATPAEPAGDPANTEADTGTEAPAEPADSTDEAAAPDETGADNSERIFTIATNSEPLVFTPLSDKSSDTKDQIILYQIYDTLVRSDQDGQLVPGLAASWEISPDGLDYTFHLQEGVTFHDGTPFTSADVKFTFETALANNANAPRLIFNYESSECPDDNTIIIHLSAPHASFLEGIAARYTGICSEAYYEAVGGWEGYQNAPIGTGAYKFVSYAAGDQIVMEAYEDYWRGAPEIKHVVVRYMADQGSQVIGLESKEIDMLLNPPIPMLQQLDTSKGVDYNITSSTTRMTLYFNAFNDLVTDDNLRKAIQYAINKEDINLAVTEATATVADIDVSPTANSHPENYPVIERNLDTALEYMEQSSYNGEEFNLMVQSGSPAQQCGEIIQSQLREIGVNVTVQALDSASFTEYINTETDFYAAVIRPYGSSYDDTDCWWAQWSITAGGLGKMIWPQSEAMTELLDANRGEVDAQKRIDVYSQVATIMEENAYCIALYYDIMSVAYNTEYTGIQAHKVQAYYLDQYHFAN